MKKSLITSFAILFLVISAQRPLSNYPNRLNLSNAIQKFNLQCQKSIFELYLYMSTNVDQVIEGALPMEEYNTKVEELVSSLTDYCHKEIEEIMSDPDAFLYDVLGASYPQQLAEKEPKWITKLIIFALRVLIATDSFWSEFKWGLYLP